MSIQPLSQSFGFGPFRLLPQQRLLLEGDRPLRLGSRALKMLEALVNNAGQVLSRETLLAEVWPGVIVDAAALRVHMAALRKVLGDGRDGRRFIATVPQRGYSFVAPVTTESLDSASEPAAPRPRPRHNLPHVAGRMFGRDDLLVGLEAELRQQRCVTLVGPGGIGKTTTALTLAARVLDEYSGGIHFVDLASLRDPTHVAQALATVLNVAAPLDHPTAQLVDALCDQQTLIILDNCEHVIDAAASLAETLLLQLPTLSLISTSREPLRIRGEWVQRLDSLVVPTVNVGRLVPLTASEALQNSAVQLFADRCAAAADGFVIDEGNVGLAVDICRRLDGIPLAIELAAGRVPEFGLQGLASLLDDLLQPLARGWRNAPPRHKTLRATLEWSHGHLSEEEQRVLRRISVFRGSFTLASGVAICGADAYDAIGGLALKSMLTIDADSEDVVYRLLDTTRAYATEKLHEASEFEATLDLHARHCAHLAKQMQSDWEHQSAERWISIYARRLDDFRAAIDRALNAEGHFALGVQLTIATGILFRQLSLLSEYRKRVERALDLIMSGRLDDPAGEMQLQSSLAHLLMHTTGITPAVEAAFCRAHALAEQLDLPYWRAKALGGMWLLRIAQADYRAAAQFSAQHRATGETAATNGGAYTQAMELHLMGRHLELRQHAAQVLSRSAVNLRLSHVTLQADTRLAMQTLLSRTLWVQGLPREALALASATVSAARHDNAVMHGVSLAFGACPVALWSGEHEKAAEWTHELLTHTQRHGLTYLQDWGRGYELLLNAESAGASLPASWERVVPWPTQLDTFRTMHSAVVTQADVIRARAGLSPWNAPEVLRRYAEQQLIAFEEDRGVAAAVEALLSESLELARTQGALSWELRTTCTLVRMWQVQQKAHAGHELLRTILQRFKEGPATRDVSAAKALLDALELPTSMGIAKLFNS